jgi:hypothetical protein
MRLRLIVVLWASASAPAAWACTRNADCNDNNPCTTDTCAETCVHTPVATGTACNDNNACTTGDACNSAGQCAGTAVVCTALDQCHAAGVCSSLTGTCSNPLVADGTGCTDGNACTLGDICQAGTCKPGSLKSCTALDQCHSVGACAPTTGLCSNPIVTNGTACTDGNACTLGDTCSGGVCVAGMAKKCAALDSCHVAGACAPATGMCANPVAADGTSCDWEATQGRPSDRCTTPNDQCQSGVCQKDPTPFVCPQQDCNQATCDPPTGLCVYTPGPAGETCGASGCYSSGLCSGDGHCSGVPKDCPASGPCKVPGCDSTSGDCFEAPAARGTACASDNPCTIHEAAVCDAAGNCLEAPVEDATPCITDACPAGGSCQQGACACGTDLVANAPTGDESKPAPETSSSGCAVAGRPDALGLALALVACVLARRRRSSSGG